MVGKLSDLISGGQVATVLLAAFLIGYFVYKEWPEFKKRVTHGALKEQKVAISEKSLEERLASIEQNLREVNEKLNRDYNRINVMDIQQQRIIKQQKDSLEEREIIMDGLLGALGGLQELGANGPTKAAESKIREYLNKKAHEHDQIVLESEG